MWAPLADTMTLVACVFLIVFIASIVGYKRAEHQRIQAEENELESAKKLERMVEDVRYSMRSAEQALETIEQEGVEVTPDGAVRLDEELLFDRGSAELKPAGRKFVEGKLANVVADIVKSPDLKILIAGHTDSVPIRTRQFPSNWELSTRRATNVLRAIIDSNPQVSSTRIFAAGFGATDPIPGMPTTDSRNRRVEILLKPQVKNLFTKVAPEKR
jgi:chemotaxis protein MotB